MLVTTSVSGPVTSNGQQSNGASIDSFIRGLKYDPIGVLAVKGDPITTVPVTRGEHKDGTYAVFRHERKSFNNSQADISAFEANNAHVYPGSLVLVNQALAKGSPVPVFCDGGCVGQVGCHPASVCLMGPSLPVRRCAHNVQSDSSVRMSAYVYSRTWVTF